MEIKDLLRKDIMILDLKAKTKMEAIDEMVDEMAKANIINDKKLFKEEIVKRENQSSTGLGEGVAMPHAKTKAVNSPAVLFARSKSGVDYEALDGEPTYIFFMIAATEGANETHIETLAKLSKLLLKPGFIEKLKNVKTKEDVFLAIESQERENELKDREEVKEDTNKPLIVAVTACPTGIAHTYMAADALKEKAKELNVDIRVETNGSDGAHDVLTKSEIERADGVIIAADRNVEMDRFDGKQLIEVPVSDGIRKPEVLINKILNKEGKIYKATGEKQSEEVKEKQSFGSRLYRDIMNGISHMLPFVVGGGILIAISFLIERFAGADSPAFIFLNSIGGGAFSFLIPILAGFVAMSIGDRPALMPGMVAGYMAVQGISFMGGEGHSAGFLGGLIGGFIAGYVILGLKKLTKNMPKSLDGLKPMLIFPVLGLLIVGFVMFFAIVPLFVKINEAMNGFLMNLSTANSVLIGAVLGGMMAVDMGGPVNKAAYTFSIGVFTDTGNGAFMAAVMAGGMVPPLAIALATTVFKERFTEKERQSGLTNYILGLSFITEGAIPFAAAEPLKVIGSSVIGAAIAGGLTQFWHVKAPAPHGGIFVLPAMESVQVGLFFIAAVLIGSIISGLIFALSRQKIKQDK